MLKAIFFDFAGVLTKRGFLETLVDSLKEDFQFDVGQFQQRFADNEEEYMSGKMSSEEFWQRLCAGMDIPYDKFAEKFGTAYQWNQDLLNLIRELKQKYKIFLLSDNFDLLYNKLKNDPALAGLFAKMYFSNEIGMTKRNSELFKHALSDSGFAAEESLFTDDKEKNTATAASVGMQTFHFTNFEDFKEYARLHLLPNS